MKYVILDISELNNIDYTQLSNQYPNTVRKSLNGLQFIIKYNDKPSFITEEIEYTHTEILSIVHGSDWTQDFEL